MSLIDRLKYEFTSGPLSGRQDTYYRLHELHHKMLVIRRGMYIMVALRRYKNKYGHWPQTLDHIMPWVTEGVLVDPQNNGPFVYKLTDDGFILYSKGKNNIDESGQRNDGADD